MYFNFILSEYPLKYFSPFAAVKIGKKKCAPSFVSIFTAAKDENYFTSTYLPFCKHFVYKNKPFADQLPTPNGVYLHNL